MITRDINSVATELTNMVISAIFHIAKREQEDEIDLQFLFHNDHYSVMRVYFPADDEELSEGEYLDEMSIEVESSYTDDEDGLEYEETTDLKDLDLGVLLQIYNTIKDR